MTPRLQDELQVEKEIIAYLRQQKWFVFKLHKSKAQAGLPDLMVIKRPFGIKFIEVKTSKGRLSQRQKTIFSRLLQEKVSLYIFTSVNDCLKLTTIQTNAHEYLL